MINKEKYIVVYNDEVKGLLSENCNIYGYNLEDVEKQFKDKYHGCIHITTLTPEEQSFASEKVKKMGLNQYE
jgi:hypothetical protein